MLGCDTQAMLLVSIKPQDTVNTIAPSQAQALKGAHT